MIILRLRRADAPTAVRMPRSPLRKIASGIIGVLDTDIPPAPIATPLESHRALLRYVERRVGDRALAQDILQDAFAKVSPDLSRHPTMKPSCRTEGSILRQFGRACHRIVWHVPSTAVSTALAGSTLSKHNRTSASSPRDSRDGDHSERRGLAHAVDLTWVPRQPGNDEPRSTFLA